MHGKPSSETNEIAELLDAVLQLEESSSATETHSASARVARALERVSVPQLRRHRNESRQVS